MPRLLRPSREEFGEYLRRRLPVVIEGGLEAWPALSQWSFDRLREAAAHVVVRVQAQHSERLGDFAYRDVAFGELVDSITLGHGRDYLVSCPLLEKVPELAGDVEVPCYAGARTAAPRVFVGPKGAISPLHYDLTHVLSAQIVGTRRIIAAEFRWRDVLMHKELRIPTWLCESIDAEAVRSRPGEIAPSKRWECTAVPGDLVFLPGLRHHFVRLLDDAISVGFFWHTPATRLVRRLLSVTGERPI